MTGPLNLNVELAGVDTARPLIPDNSQVPMLVKEVAVDDNKARTGKNLIVTFATAAPCVSTKNKQINPGFVLTKYYPLQPSQKQIDSGMGDRPFIDLSMLVDALFGTDESNRPNLTGEVVSQMTGKQALVVIRIRDSEDYGEQNEIARVLPLN